MIAGIITLLGFAIFLVDSDDVASRLSLFITLQLTLVAFKFVVSDHIPKVSYFTALDLYLSKRPTLPPLRPTPETLTFFYPSLLLRPALGDGNRNSCGEYDEK